MGHTGDGTGPHWTLYLHLLTRSRGTDVPPSTDLPHPRKATHTRGPMPPWATVDLELLTVSVGTRVPPCTVLDQLPTRSPPRPPSPRPTGSRPSGPRPVFPVRARVEAATREGSKATLTRPWPMLPCVTLALHDLTRSRGTLVLRRTELPEPSKATETTGPHTHVHAPDRPPPHPHADTPDPATPSTHRRALTGDPGALVSHTH